MCETSEATTKAIDIQEKMDNFFQKNSLTWNHAICLCTGGAPFMLGAKSGLTMLVKKSSPPIISTLCVLHPHALASKTLLEYLKIALKKVTECVNFIRAHALNHRFFKQFCDQMGSEHNLLLCHTEVRWLSRGRVLF